MIAPDDGRWMALALRAARHANPSPNPRVGAVVVARGQFVSLGWHDRAGGAHAEMSATASAGARVRGATLYVTLEPCNHYGRTPPCVDTLLTLGLARVVVGCCDPNPHVTGGGIERLRRHGIEVQVGVLAREARSVIEEWSEGLIPRAVKL